MEAWRGNLVDYPKKLFGLITLNKVLEHLKDPISLLKLSKNLLIQGGLIYLEVPNVDAQKDGRTREEFLSGLVHIFSKESLEIVIKKSGLQVVQISALIEPSGKFTLRAICS